MLAPALAHGAPILALSPPSGALSGLPGAVLGWGFTISNQDPDYLVVTGANLCTTQVVGGVTFCDQFANPSLGAFTDYIAQFNFIIAGPAPENPIVSQPFDQNLLTGVGSFAIDPGAVPGARFSGEILLTYDLYSRSPNDSHFDAGADFISSGNTLTQAASVTAIPEPTTFLLLAAGLVGLRWRRLRR
jgi:PEP-CTERM motif